MSSIRRLQGKPALALSSLLLTAIGWTALQAGGPLLLESDGAAYRWGGTPPTVVFYPDAGSLGHLLPETALANLLTAAQSWTDVPSASVVMQNGGIVGSIEGPEGPGDFAVENYFSFLFANNGGVTPIIFDSQDEDGNGNGDIFDDLGLPAGVLGIATPEFADGNSITEGWVLLNGSEVDPGDLDGASFRGIIAHELGHLLNLAHTLVNGQAIFFAGSDAVFPDGSAMQVEGDDIETMYPFSDPTPDGLGLFQTSLHRDDIAILSTLYPEAAMPLESLGSIRGVLRDNAGLALTGGQIIVRNRGGDPFQDAVSAISGDFLQDTLNGGPLTGTYTLNALTPGGEYSLEVRDTVAGGFSTPILRSPAAFGSTADTLPGPEEFYSGPAESSSDDPKAAPFLIETPAGGPGAAVEADLTLNGFNPPVNDGCNDAIAVNASSLPFVDQRLTLGAVREVEEPPNQCGNFRAGSSVWYEFTNNSGLAGTFLISTVGSEYDTILQVYTGSCLATTPRQCDDDGGGGGRTSQLAIDAQPDQTFRIKVTDFNTTPGGGLLNFSVQEVTVPVNDDCVDAMEIDLLSLPFVDEVDTRAAGNELGEASNSCGVDTNPSTFNTVWYSFTHDGPEPLALRARTLGSSFDTILQLYSGQCMALSAEACNDDESDSLTSDLLFTAQPGQTYLLKASGFGGGGNLILRLEQSPPTPQNDDCADAIEVTRGDLPFVDERDTRTAGNEFNEPQTSCGSFQVPAQSNSVWYTFANDSQLPIDLHLSTRGSRFEPILQIYEGVCGSFTPLECEDAGGFGLPAEIDWRVEPGARIWVKISNFGTPGGGRLVFRAQTQGVAGEVVALNVRRSRESLMARSSLEYEVAVKNLSNEAVTGVTLNSALTAGATFTELAAGCTAEGSRSSCQIGTLAAGAEVVLNLAAAPRAPGNLSLTASADWDQADAQELSFGATLVTPVEPLLVFPATLEADSTILPAANGPSGLFDNGFVGLAVVNPSDSADNFAVEGVDAQGNDTFVSDPEGALAPRGQSAKVSTEISGLADDTLTLLARGENNLLRGFFMAGRDDGSQLDGIGGRLPINRFLVFPVARQSATDSTRLFLHNPFNQDASQVDLALKDEGGNTVSQATFAIPSAGTLSATLEKAFGIGADVADGYIEVSSSVALQGFQFHATSQAVEAFAAQADEVVRELFAPHFFLDGQDNSTDIRLISLDSVPLDVTVTAFDNQGIILAQSEFVLQPGELFVRDLGLMLNLNPPPGSTVSGFLRIDQVAQNNIGPDFFTAAHLLGAVTFRFNGGQVLSSLPMSAAGRLQWELYQVAQSPSVNMFTGLAILNTTPPFFASPAQIRVEAFDAQGNLSGQREFTVEAEERVLGLLNEDLYFGEGFDQVGGHIRISSDSLVVVFALFGDFAQQFLAAIEAQNP